MTNTNAHAHTDITIVGGGMVGITLALLLAKANSDWTISLIEAHAFNVDAKQAAYQPSFDTRSTALAAGSRKILEQCDVWSQLQQHLTPIQQVHVSDRGHFGGAQINASQYGLDAVGYVVENAWLGRVLMASLLAQNNIRGVAPAKVKRLQPRAHGYQISLEHSELEIIDTSLAIIVDGAQSPLAKSLGVQFSVDAYEQVALIANVETTQAHQGIAYERFTDEGPIALLPLGESKTSRTHALVWTLPEHDQQRIQQYSDTEFLAALQTRFGHRQGNFVRVSQRSTYPLQLILAKEQIRRNLVLMGNAAHFLHPVAGQGFNLALRDCLTLCKVLMQNSKMPLGELSVLQQYLDSQMIDQTLTIEMSDQFVRMFSTNQFGHSVLRNMGLFMLEALPGAGGLLAKQTMGMG